MGNVKTSCNDIENWDEIYRESLMKAHKMNAGLMVRDDQYTLPLQLLLVVCQFCERMEQIYLVDVLLNDDRNHDLYVISNIRPYLITKSDVHKFNKNSGKCIQANDETLSLKISTFNIKYDGNSKGLNNDNIGGFILFLKKIKNRCNGVIEYSKFLKTRNNDDNLDFRFNKTYNLAEEKLQNVSYKHFFGMYVLL